MKNLSEYLAGEKDKPVFKRGNIARAKRNIFIRKIKNKKSADKSSALSTYLVKKKGK